MPEMGESVTEGTVLEWHVEEGQQVAEGDTVVEVSTDKIDAEVPGPGGGHDHEAPGRGRRHGPGRPGAGGDERRRDGAAGAGSTPTPAADDRRGRRRRLRRPTPSNGRASPVARRVAAAKGVDIGAVKGSGPGGKVTKEDVLAAADGDGAGRRAAAPAAEAEAKPLRGPAAMLAKAMNESRSMPTATSFRTLPVDTLDAKRKALNGALKERGMKVSFTHLIAWAIVKAATRVAGDGAQLRGARRQAARGRARARQPRDRGRRRAQGRLAQPDGPLHQGRRRRSTSPASTPPTRS